MALGYVYIYTVHNVHTCKHAYTHTYMHTYIIVLYLHVEPEHEIISGPLPRESLLRGRRGREALTLIVRGSRWG